MTWIVDEWRAALARDGRVALMPSRFQAQVCLGLAGLLAVLGVWAGFRGGWSYGLPILAIAVGVAVPYALRLRRPRPLVVVTTSGIAGNHGRPATYPIPFFLTGGHPAVPRRVTSSGHARTQDVAPTVAAFFGVAAPRGGWDGRSRL